MKNLTVRDAQIIYRNFRGEGKRFNPEGHRNFTVVFDEETALRLKEDGWNIKMRDAIEEGDEMTGTLQVAVSYKHPMYIPEIIQITSGGKVALDEEDIHILDVAAIEKIDLTIRPSKWEVNGSSGIKAYLKKACVTIEEDELDEDYADIPWRK